MSIFSNIFSPKPAATPAPQQQPVAAPPGNMQSPDAVAANSNVANAPATPPAQDPSIPNKQDTPLDAYAHLWENTPSKEGKPAAKQSLSQDQLTKAVAKTDFAKSITPEQMQAINQGGEGAAAAFAEAMNNVARDVMTQTTMVNNKLGEHNLAQVRKEFEDALPALLRKQGAANHLKESNPLFSNPAVKPIVAATQQQLLQKYPDATQAQITEMTNDFILAMGQSFAPAPAADPSAPPVTDWSKFLD